MNDPHILTTTLWVYGILFTVAIGLTLAFRGTGWGRNMTQAISSWLVIFALFISLGYYGSYPFVLLIWVICFVATREFYQLTGACGREALVPAAILSAIAGWAAVNGHMRVFLALPAASIVLLLPAYLWRKGTEDFIRIAAIRVFGFIYWGWLPMHFIVLRGLDGGFGYVVLLCTMIALNDNSAYYVGKLLGQNSRKMAPVISPNKTWTGFIGGTGATLLCAVLFRYTAPVHTLSALLVVALVTALCIPVGDLIESAMKRDLGVKDTSNLIPGHGGMMDRFDSWAFTVPIFTIMMEWMVRL